MLMEEFAPDTRQPTLTAAVRLYNEFERDTWPPRGTEAKRDELAMPLCPS